MRFPVLFLFPLFLCAEGTWFHAGDRQLVCDLRDLCGECPKNITCARPDTIRLHGSSAISATSAVNVLYAADGVNAVSTRTVFEER